MLDQRIKDAFHTIRKLGKYYAKSFRGELVAQDEKDEPVDQLLAKIKAEIPAKKSRALTWPACTSF